MDENQTDARTLDEIEQDLQQAAQTPVPAKISLGGEEYDPDTLAELVSKGKDYTQKTQTLAEQRREVEALQSRIQQDPVGVVMAAINAAPASERKALAAEFAKMQGLSVIDAQTGQPMTANTRPEDMRPPEWDDMVPNEQKLWLANQELRGQLQAFGTAFNEVKGYIDEQRQERQFSTQVQLAQAAIKAETGQDIPGEAFELAVKETGIKDPESAWLKKHWKDLAKGAYQAGTQSAPGVKPDTPSSSGDKTYDPNDPDLTVDQIERLLAAGYRPEAKRK